MRSPELSGRRSGRVESPNASHLVSGQVGNGTRDDSLPLLSDDELVRVGRLAGVMERLTPVDREIIGSIERCRMVSGAQLQRLHFGAGENAGRSARRHLTRLVELRVLARLERRIGGVRAGSAGFVYGLDVVGQRLGQASSPRRPWTPSPAFVAHTVAVSECFVTATLLAGAGRLELLDFLAEPACWRTWTGAGGTPLTLKPDAWLRVASEDFEDRWFIEVDRATEDLGRIRRKAEVYRRYFLAGREDPFPKVLWLTPGERRAAALRDSLGALPSEQRQLFQVAVAAQFAEVLLAGPDVGALEGSR